MSDEVWEQVYDRLAQLIEEHRTTLVFVNTRRLAERVTRQLSERLGERQVSAHHGSLAKEQRLDAEQRLKGGELKALVATASLELGIDIGDVDLVCQLGSPRSIASFLQRVGRSGHAVDGMPKGRLFPLSRDELVECAALLDASGAASSTGSRSPSSRSTCWRSRSSPRSPRASGARTSCSRCPPRLALPRACARGLRCRGGHAGGGLQHAARPARRADPPRRGQPRAARPARRAPDRAHLRRHDPGHRRLPGDRSSPRTSSSAP